MPDSPVRDLFPAIEPYETGRLAVDHGHEIYWEICGNPKGQPVVFLHGGPGAGCSRDHRRFFDPAHYRVLLFDQRGCGRSSPHAEVEANTTADLIRDIEALRGLHGIDRWLVFGGSWGSTLGLAYAITHPDQVSGLILRGIFMCTAREIDWFLTGMGRFFPEVEARFLEAIPPAERGELLAAYYRRLCDPDPKVHGPAAQAWSVYEASCTALRPDPQTVAAFSDPKMALSIARLEAHYFVHDSFLDKVGTGAGLLAQVDRLADIPGTIVQGRYDVICPPETAAALAKAWPKADYLVVPDAGHSAMEGGIRRALVAATERAKSYR